MSPRAVARQLVRAILASMVRSTRQFSAAAAKETRAMPRAATRKRSSGGKPGVARNMPIIAVNTIRLLTRGLQRWAKAARRWPKLRVGAATVCMAILLAGPGEFEQSFEIGAHALGGGVGWVSHDQLPWGVGQQQGIGAAGRRRGDDQQVGLGLAHGGQLRVVRPVGEDDAAQAAHRSEE